MLEDATELGHLRMPSCREVLDAVHENHVLLLMFQDSKAFKSRGHQEVLFDAELWKAFRAQLMRALQRCFAFRDKDTKRLEARYFAEKTRLIQTDTTNLCVRVHVDVDARDEATLLLCVMRMRFVESFHKLISPLSAAPVHSISQQVNQKAKEILDKSSTDLFPNKLLREHVYYIVGFFGNQSAKEARRRKKGSMIAKLLAYFASANFVTCDHESYGELIANDSIPSGMVQRRMKLGGLKFATMECWDAFARIESIYSSLVTPGNFLLMGGRLSGDICTAIVNNFDMQNIFFPLLCSDYKPITNEESIDASRVKELADQNDAMIDCFRYIMRVFHRVRGKDVSRRYNSSAFKGNQVQFRASIGAMSGNKGKKSKKKHANNSSTTHVTATANSSQEEDDNVLHGSIVDELTSFDNEQDTEDNSRKIATEGVHDGDDNM